MQHPRPKSGARGNSDTSLGSDAPEYTDALHAFQAHWQRLGDVTARIVERLRRLGQRADLEAVVEVAAVEIDAGIVEALHGEHFPPPPIHEVSS